MRARSPTVLRIITVFAFIVRNYPFPLPSYSLVSVCNRLKKKKYERIKKEPLISINLMNASSKNRGEYRITCRGHGDERVTLHMG